MIAFVGFARPFHITQIKFISNYLPENLFSPNLAGRSFDSLFLQLAADKHEGFVLGRHLPDLTKFWGDFFIEHDFMGLFAVRMRWPVIYEFVSVGQEASDPAALADTGDTGGLHAFAGEHTLKSG